MRISSFSLFKHFPITVSRSTVSDSLKSSLVQISVVSSKGTLVNTESTSKLPIKRLCCWLTVSSEKWKESLTVNSFVVKGFEIGTKNFASLVSRSIQDWQSWSKWRTIPYTSFIYLTWTLHDTWSGTYWF